MQTFYNFTSENKLTKSFSLKTDILPRKNEIIEFENTMYIVESIIFHFQTTKSRWTPPYCYVTVIAERVIK